MLVAGWTELAASGSFGSRGRSPHHLDSHAAARMGVSPSLRQFLASMFY